MSTSTLREVINYDDARVPLVCTDVEKLESKPDPVYLTGQLGEEVGTVAF